MLSHNTIRILTTFPAKPTTPRTVVTSPKPTASSAVATVAATVSSTKEAPTTLNLSVTNYLTTHPYRYTGILTVLCTGLLISIMLHL